MKVLHVLNSREYTGAEKVVCQIIRDFRGEVPMGYCSPYSENIRDMLQPQGVDYHPIDSLTPRQLRQVIHRFQPDIIHAHDMRASFVSALCCGKIPLISHIHNNAYDARGLSMKSIAYLLAGVKAKKILWVSQSSYEGYLFHRLFQKKSQILYNIIDTREIQEKLQEDTNRYAYDVIFVGRLTYQKDPQRLLHLCRQLKEKLPQVQLAIVGSGELAEECQTLSRELGLQDNVHFLGFQKNPIKMIADSKLLMLTSRWEGTPMCALEAMAVGTPVVSTPSDGMSDLLTDGKDGFLGEQDAQLLAAMERLITDESLRSRIGSAGKARFEAYNDARGYQAAIMKNYQDLRKL